MKKQQLVNLQYNSETICAWLNSLHFELSPPSKFYSEVSGWFSVQFLKYYVQHFKMHLRAGQWECTIRANPSETHLHVAVLIFFFNTYCSYQLLELLSVTYIQCSPVDCDLYSTIPDIIAHNTVCCVGNKKQQVHPYCSCLHYLLAPRSYFHFSLSIASTFLQKMFF